MPLRSFKPPKVKIALSGAEAAPDIQGIKRKSANAANISLIKLNIAHSSSFLLVKSVDKSAPVPFFNDRGIDELFAVT